jgi:hypothetical protein
MTGAAAATTLVAFNHTALGKGLDDIKPPPSAAAIEAAEKSGQASANDPGPVPPSPGPSPQPSVAPAPPEKATDTKAAEKAAPEPPSRAERFVSDNIEIGTAVNFVWASRPGSSWNNSGSGRQGSSDLLLMFNFPNETLGLRETNQLRFKGTFRYSPVAVAGTLDGLPFRGIWEGYLAGIQGRMKTPWAKGMTVLAGVEAGFVFVYLEPTDDFATPKTAEANGAIVSLHTGADWEVMPKISVGPRVYTSFGGFQLLQIGLGGTFAF